MQLQQQQLDERAVIEENSAAILIPKMHPQRGLCEALLLFSDCCRSILY